MMHAALDINIPNYASAIVPTNEKLLAICSRRLLRCTSQLVALLGQG